MFEIIVTILLVYIAIQVWRIRQYTFVIGKNLRVIAEGYLAEIVRNTKGSR